MNPIKEIISRVDTELDQYGWYRSYRNDYGYRTLFFAVIGAVTTALFAIYNGVFGILNGSLWYGAFAGYLIILAFQRILVLILRWAAVKKRGDDNEELFNDKLKIYLANGAVFVPLTIALAVIISAILSSDGHGATNNIIAIMTATYAFLKIAMAISNLVKAKSYRDPIIQTIRNISFVDALTSIIMLENTLVTTFGELTYTFRMLIIVSGLIVCSVSVGIGSFMIINACKQLKIGCKQI